MAIGRKTGGRKAGTPNHATQEIKALAGLYAGEAVEWLADLMRHGESEATRLAAIRELLDRGFGRPALHADIKGEVQAMLRSYREMSDEELMEIIERGRTECENDDDSS